MHAFDVDDFAHLEGELFEIFEVGNSKIANFGLFSVVVGLSFVESGKKKTTIGCLSRAENEARTRDPNLGKVMLYQLSYFRKNW